jgi:SprT protein
MLTPPPVPKDIIARAEDKVIEVYLQAQSIWKQIFALPTIEFDLLGRCAGRAYCRENRIRLNPVLLLENQTDFIEETVPHEVAHLLTRTLYLGPGRMKPHGPEWKAVMLALGLKPTRCHDYDTTNAQVRQERRFSYACACRTIQEPARTHFKLQRGEIWSRCSFCGAHFTLQGGGTS